MDIFRLVSLICMVISASECSAEPECEDFDPELFKLLEGEAFYFKPYGITTDVPDFEIKWYKNNSEYITTDENQSVHYHGGALFFLKLRTEDSGSYTAQHDASGKCNKYYLKLKVFKESSKELHYGKIENSDRNKKVECPTSVKQTCKMTRGRLSWSKDNKPLQGNNTKLWVTQEGVYTCICSWTHNNKQHKSSGSKRVLHKGILVNREIKIISPVNKEELADEGAVLKLYCSVSCGVKVEEHCDTRWSINGNPPDQTDGYSQTTETTSENPSKTTISTAILTIEKVSAKDFQSDFKCIGTSFFEEKDTTLTVKRRETIMPLVTGGVCAFLFCVFAIVLVKCFTVDLVLFFRRFFPLSIYRKDMRMYDAYVIYQMQSEDKLIEDTLCQFVTKTLPSVLEDRCGYRLFIHGRDDIPGEDRLELVEDRMKQSRRLMVILTPGSGPESESSDQLPASIQDSVIGGFDWQVGIHHALFQREMSVILIQLGDTGPHGYTHLPAGLQHLICKGAPIKWPEGSRGGAGWNSRFWKRVRYLMPARPARLSPQAATV